MTLVQIEIPDEDNNPFVSLRDLLQSSKSISRQQPIAILATAIESSGIYTWDKYGRYNKFSQDTPEGLFALRLLECVHTFEQGNSDEQHPLDSSADFDDPFSSFGWATRCIPDFNTIKNNQPEVSAKIKKPSPRENSSNLRIIAALLEFISGETPGVKKHPEFVSQAKFIQSLLSPYDGYEGLSQKNLELKFKDAKDSLKQS